MTKRCECSFQDRKRDMATGTCSTCGGTFERSVIDMITAGKLIEPAWAPMKTAGGEQAEIGQFLLCAYTGGHWDVRLEGQHITTGRCDDLAGAKKGVAVEFCRLIGFGADGWLDVVIDLRARLEQAIKLARISTDDMDAAAHQLHLEAVDALEQPGCAGVYDRPAEKPAAVVYWRHENGESTATMGKLDLKVKKIVAEFRWIVKLGDTVIGSGSGENDTDAGGAAVSFAMGLNGWGRAAALDELTRQHEDMGAYADEPTQEQLRALTNAWFRAPAEKYGAARAMWVRGARPVTGEDAAKPPEATELAADLDDDDGLPPPRLQFRVDALEKGLAEVASALADVTNHATSLGDVRTFGAKLIAFFGPMLEGKTPPLNGDDVASRGYVDEAIGRFQRAIERRYQPRAEPLRPGVKPRPNTTRLAPATAPTKKAAARRRR